PRRQQTPDSLPRSLRAYVSPPNLFQSGIFCFYGHARDEDFKPSWLRHDQLLSESHDCNPLAHVRRRLKGGVAEGLLSVTFSFLMYAHSHGQEALPLDALRGTTPEVRWCGSRRSPGGHWSRHPQLRRRVWPSSASPAE